MPLSIMARLTPEYRSSRNPFSAEALARKVREVLDS